MINHMSEKEARELFKKALDWYVEEGIWKCDVRFIEGKYYPEGSWGRLNGGQWGCNLMGNCAVIKDGKVKDLTSYPTY